jgi:hypothetical protein
MKTQKTFNALLVKLALSLGAVFFLSTSCQQTAENPTQNLEATEADAIAQADFDEIDDISQGAMGYSDGSIGGRTDGSDERGMDERAACATVTHDKEAQTITIDFGEGCTGPYGHIRKGVIFITYTGRRFEPGAKWTITLRDFYIDERHIEGTRTVENVSQSLEDNPKFHITLVGGKITWADGTFATREVDRYRVWVRAANPMRDEMHILEGSVALGINKEGVDYNSTVLTDLVYKRACRTSQTARFPVSGVKEITVGDATIVIDFGDGECDSLADVTKDGVTTEVDLSDRGN